MTSDFTADFADYAREDLDRSGPAEWAFETLLRIAAFGLHDSNRHKLRVMTMTARERYRAATTEGDPMIIYYPAAEVLPYYADDGLGDHAPSEAAKLRLTPAEYRQAAEEEMWRRTAHVEGLLSERSEVARRVRTEVLLEVAAQLLKAGAA